jgi:exportin-7
MNEDILRKIETACEQVYNALNTERHLAEQQLAGFSRVESVGDLKLIFDKSKNPYALFFAASQLLKLFTNNWNTFTKNQKNEIRNFLCNYVAQNGPNLPNFVLQVILQLLGRITKLGWLEEQANRDLPELIKKYFIQPRNPTMSSVGIQLLDNIVIEMNTLSSRKSLTQHRKIAISFRDLALRGVFETSLFALKEVLVEDKTLNTPQQKLSNDVLQLALDCLKFDFVGIFPDESTEDIGTIQIPAPWRPLFEDSDTVQLFWNLYMQLPTSYGKAKALQILILLSSVRRSLFAGDEERKVYLSKFINGIIGVLETKNGLTEQENYHEFCRLLARIKSNFQLNEFVTCANYSKWLDLCANFSIESFRSWRYSNPSVFYILSLWSRLVASKPYLKSDMESHLDSHVPQVCEQYIISRLDYARACAHDDSIENPFEHRENLDEQLEALPQLVHSNYDKISHTFTALFDPLFISYQEAVSQKKSPLFAEIEIQLTWLAFMFGAVIGKRYVSSSSAEDAEIIDANLSARVFRLIPLVTERVQSTPNAFEDESLQFFEYSIMYFMKHFKRVYLGDTMVTHSKIYTRISELLPQLQDQLQILNVFINKIATNLKIWAKNENIVKQTLALFDDIATGYSSAKLAVKLDSTKFILKNHGVQTFPFLVIPGNERHRTTFYNTLCKLLFLSDYTEDDFIDFMKPLEVVCMQLEAINSAEQFRRDDVKLALIGWFRDLRGICTGCTSKKSYNFLFDWVYPNHVKILIRAAEVWFDTPAVTTSLLKFLAEFVLNRNSRIAFGSNSVNGILLFKETSDLLCAYGTRIAGVAIRKNPYDEKYKGIHIAMTALSRSLSGNYCNFGVFKLYNDNSLIKVLDVVIRLALTIPLEDVIAYTKLCKSYFGLLEILFSNHTEMIVSVETPIFLKLLASLEEGIKLEDLGLSSQICAALDHLCTYYYTQVKKNTPQAQLLQKHLKQNQDVFPRILAQFFNMIMFQECGNQWSLSRTMLSLIVINPVFFEQLKQQIATSIGGGEERQQKIREAFDKLMQGVEMDLESKNRDKFTGNLITFRSIVKEIL